jgi:maltose alpha-D-glucosyltransferase/alpha-amylase
VAVHDATERGRIGETEADRVEAWRRTWTTQMQEALLDSYLDRMSDSALIPTDRSATQFLLDVYILIKCLYEVRYELANRPDWVGWPLSSVVELIDPGGQR